ncbi:hypothetical protein E3N88_14963 [Mikania micrantha]|uniref:Uncharacterized protein n=1 Tax=Mikania micrantha TaxID=192012 RepID=A0A5N6P4W8_9ASTR|nr:hypothetical protein E3N88_14963 [Mikania micrantha]
MILTSSRYAMRRNTAFAIREGFRGFPACFVYRDTRYEFELVVASVSRGFDIRTFDSYSTIDREQCLVSRQSSMSIFAKKALSQQVVLLDLT